jgi:hypothetical protein
VKRFTMRLSDEEHERQQRVAAFYNLSVAVILRLLVAILDEASKGRKEGAKHAAELELLSASFAAQSVRK